MKLKFQWYFDEHVHAGINYSDKKIVADYDNQHGKFRDFKSEALRIVHALTLSPNDTIIDMGCGSGGLSIHLAEYCNKIYAVDISPEMIELCNKKIAQKNIDNISTVCCGLLSYTHEGEAVDAVISNIVLHHLPDFWKLIALKKINDILKPGGKFFLFDVVFSFPLVRYEESISNWLQEMEKKAGKKMMEETIIHIREEFSTWDWILEKMLDLAGFTITYKMEEMPNITGYICYKNI